MDVPMDHGSNNNNGPTDTEDSRDQSTTVEDEVRALKLLESETKAWRNIHERWELALHQLDRETSTAAKTHRKPLLSDDLKELMAWIDDTQRHQVQLADSHAVSVAIIQSHQAVTAACYRVMDAALDDLSEKMAEKFGGDEGGEDADDELEDDTDDSSGGSA